MAFELPKALLKLYSELDISLEKSNGVEGAKGLPMPATFVIRTDRTIAYAHVEADYTRRSEPLEVSNHVRELENVTAWTQFHAMKTNTLFTPLEDILRRHGKRLHGLSVSGARDGAVNFSSLQRTKYNLDVAVIGGGISGRSPGIVHDSRP